MEENVLINPDNNKTSINLNNLKSDPKFIFKLIKLFLILLVFVFLNLILDNFISIKIEQRVQKYEGMDTATEPDLITNPDFRNLTLKKLNPQGEEKIFSIDKDLPQPVQWKDFLFYPIESTNNDVSEVKLMSYNLVSGETKTIYQEKPQKETFFLDIKIINDTLYFSFGGYMQKNSVYYLNLPPSSAPIEIAKGRNQTIELIRNNYFIVGGDGDSCGGFHDYSFLDIKSKKVIPIFSGVSGCIEGEEYLGIDSKNRLLFSYHTVMYSDDEEKYPYKNLGYVSIFNPNIKGDILGKEKFSDGISFIGYSEKLDKLLLVLKSKFLIYNSASDSIEKEIDIPNNIDNFNIDYWDESCICLENYIEEAKSEIVKFDIFTEKLISNDQFCQNKLNQEEISQKEKSIYDIYKKTDLLKYNLPSEYKFEFE